MSRVDIVIPCHNYSEYLSECVDSVTRQSHRDLRILIIDDASTDATPEVSEQLAAGDRRIEVRRHEIQHGHIETYNEGISWAEGDYWLLLSADDFLLPGALERAVSALDSNRDFGLVYGASVEFKMNQNLPFKVLRPSGRSRATATLAEQKAGTSGVCSWKAEDLIDSLGIANHVGVSTAVARLSVQKTIGVYRKDLPHAGDLEMWLRFALTSGVGYIDALQAVYRLHGRNMSNAYPGYRDFRQRVLAFDLHLSEIGDRLAGGRKLARRLRWRHGVQAAKWAIRALLEGRMDQFRELCHYPTRGTRSAGSDLR